MEQTPVDPDFPKEGKIVENPSGLPDGWWTLQKQYKTGKFAGGLYVRYTNGNKEVPSIKAAVLADAKDKGADPAEGLGALSNKNKCLLPPEALPDYDPAESGLSADVLECLPPDAPAKHDAWTKIRQAKDGHGNKILIFNFNKDGTKIHFQTTQVAAGSLYAAFRICRACYVKFQEGSSKEATLEFRKECYAKLKAASSTAPDTNASAAPSKARKRKREDGDDTAAEVSQPKSDDANAKPARSRPKREVAEAKAGQLSQPSQPSQPSQQNQSSPPSQPTQPSQPSQPAPEAPSATQLVDEDKDEAAGFQIRPPSSSSSSSPSSPSDDDLPSPEFASADGQPEQTMLQGHQRAKPKIWACAKMLVRSGLRCSCHYLLKFSCPGQHAPMPGTGLELSSTSEHARLAHECVTPPDDEPDEQTGAATRDEWNSWDSKGRENNVCFNYLEGSCKYGNDCYFSHDAELIRTYKADHAEEYEDRREDKYLYLPIVGNNKKKGKAYPQDLIEVRYKGKWWDGTFVGQDGDGYVQALVDGKEYSVREADLNLKPHVMVWYKNRWFRGQKAKKSKGKKVSVQVDGRQYHVDKDCVQYLD